MNLFEDRSDHTWDLYPTKASELRPGCYCEIEMILPPNTVEGSSHCYKGVVQSITSDEIVLVNVSEISQIDYSSNGHHHKPTEEKRDLVRVPLTGINVIYAFRPPRPEPSQAAGQRGPAAGGDPVALQRHPSSRAGG